MYKFFEHLKDCYYEIKAMSFKSRLNFDLSFWKYLFLRGLTVARSSWNCQKLKKLKVDLGKVEFVRSWKSEKLKIAWVENAKVEKFQSWKCKCWICEKLKLQKLKRQGWKCKVENAEVEPSRSPEPGMADLLKTKVSFKVDGPSYLFNIHQMLSASPHTYDKNMEYMRNLSMFGPEYANAQLRRHPMSLFNHPMFDRNSD